MQDRQLFAHASHLLRKAMHIGAMATNDRQAQAVRKEAELFESDAVLQRLPSRQCGMPRLLEKVCAEQSRAIDEYIPKFRKAASELLRTNQKEMDALPRSLTTPEEQRDFVARKIGEIANDIRRASEADTSVCDPREKSTKLSARVHEALRQGLADRIKDQMPDFLSDAIKDQLQEATVEGLGHNLSNFMQGGAFRNQFVSAIDPLLGETAADRNSC